MNQEKYVCQFPLSVITIDVYDAYALADVFDEERRYAVIARDFASLEKSIEMADRLFAALNPNVKTLDEWVESDSGFDVRVYDKAYHCMYKAHTTLTK